MDVKNMKDLENNSFNIIIDKACIDCLYVIK